MDLPEVFAGDLWSILSNKFVVEIDPVHEDLRNYVRLLISRSPWSKNKK
jgi:hypothetical protein